MFLFGSSLIGLAAIARKRFFRIWNATFKFIGLIYREKYPKYKV